MIDQLDSDVPWPTVPDEAPTLNGARNLSNVFVGALLSFYKVMGADRHSVEVIMPTSRRFGRGACRTRFVLGRFFASTETRCRNVCDRQLYPRSPQPDLGRGRKP